MDIAYFGPSEPKSYALFNQPFYFQGKTHKSLFHAVSTVDPDATIEEAHAKALGTVSHGDAVILTLALTCAFGVYAFQHRELVVRAMKYYYKGTRFVMEGVTPHDPHVVFSMSDICSIVNM